VEAYRPASPLPGSPSAAADSSAPSAIALTAAPANAIALNTLPANAPAADMTAAPDDVQSTFATSFGADAIKGNPVRMTTYKVRDMSNQVYEDLSAKLAREAYERTLLPLYTTDITTDVRFAGTTIDRDGSRRVSGLSLLSFNW
jgi:hypothetical protein